VFFISDVTFVRYYPPEGEVSGHSCPLQRLQSRDLSASVRRQRLPRVHPALDHPFVRGRERMRANGGRFTRG